MTDMGEWHRHATAVSAWRNGQKAGQRMAEARSEAAQPA